MENLLYLKDFFHDKAKFTFTFVGSEKHASKSLFNLYFKDKPETANYNEFDQGDVTPGYNNPFLNMLSEKFKFSFYKSIEKKPNITLLNGSNDFISFNFFEQIISSYNSKQSQLFGIDNFLNGKNITDVLVYDHVSNKFTNEFIWNGIQKGREKYMYIGGIIGWNDTFYNENKLHLNRIITYDEGEIENKSCSISTTVKFQSRDCIFLNIKSSSSSSSDITPFKCLKKWETKNLLSLLSHQTQQKLILEKEMFLGYYSADSLDALEKTKILEQLGDKILKKLKFNELFEKKTPPDSLSSSPPPPPPPLPPPLPPPHAKKGPGQKKCGANHKHQQKKGWRKPNGHSCETADAPTASPVEDASHNTPHAAV
jgi:hypothetical protein